MDDRVEQRMSAGPADPFSAFPHERVKRALLHALAQHRDVSIQNVANYWDQYNRSGFRAQAAIGIGPTQRLVEITVVSEPQQ